MDNPTQSKTAKSLMLVYKKAAVNAPVLAQLLQQVAKRSQAKIVSNFKNPETAVEKVDQKNDEEPGRNYKLQDVNDIARGRLIFNSYDALKKGVENLKSAIKKTNIKVGPEDNFFTHAKSDGYQGYHVDLEFPNGQHSEVQFHTPQSYAAVLATHPAHEEFGGEMPPEATQKNESLSKHIMQLPTEQANQLSQQAEQTNMPAIMKGQQAAQGVIQQAMAQPPRLAAFPPSKGGAGNPATPGMIQNAISMLKGNLNKADRAIIGHFAEKVETGKDKGNLGETGAQMQSLTKMAFGQQAARNWSNKQVKEAFDQVVQGVMEGQNG